MQGKEYNKGRCMVVFFMVDTVTNTAAVVVELNELCMSQSALIYRAHIGYNNMLVK